MAYVTTDYLKTQFSNYSRTLLKTFQKIENVQIFVVDKASLLPTPKVIALGYAVNSETIIPDGSSDPVTYAAGFYVYSVADSTWTLLDLGSDCNVYIGNTEPSDKSLIWVDNTDITKTVMKIYKQDTTEWITISGSGSSKFPEAFTVNTAVGGVPVGRQITTDDEVAAIVKDMLLKYIKPSWTKAVFASSNTANILKEIGEQVTSLSFRLQAKENSKPITDVTITAKDSSGIPLGITYTGTTPDKTTIKTQADYPFTTGSDPYIDDTNVTYTATVTDNQDPATATLTLKFARAAFSGAVTGSTTPMSTSAEVRALSKSVSASYSTFNLKATVGATKVVLAVPATYNVSSIKYVEGMNAEVKDAFVVNTVQVEGANGYAAVDYKVYEYIPAVPFSAECNYKVTL